MNTALLIVIIIVVAYLVHKQLCKQGIDIVSEGLIVIKRKFAEGYTNPVGVLSRSPAFVIPGTLARVSV